MRFVVPNGCGDRQRIHRAVAAGRLRRIDRGLFLNEAVYPQPWEEFAAIIIRRPSLVIGLTSALDYHGVATLSPPGVFVAIPPNRHAPRWSWPAIQPYRLRAPRLGIAVHRVAGVDVSITSVERALVDVFAHLELVDRDTRIEALRTALAERRVQVTTLLRYAQAVGVADTLSPYLDALT